MILQVSNVSKYFGDEILFKDVNFSINEGERVALIGANGCGKSTLIKMILGKEEISPNKANEPKGTVSFAKGISIGYLSQEVISNVHNTLYEEALSVFEEVIKLEKSIQDLASKISENPEDIALQRKYGNALDRFEHLDGYNYLYLVEMILLKFGFTKEDFSMPIVNFSGGEKTKMAFAKLLLLKPDLLILDEPTNHLDISTIHWLEEYLKSYKGSILFVSHDRYFIDALADKIIEIENNEITIFKGNYDKYMVYKKEHYESMLKAYNLQQKEIERIKRFITYYKPKPRFVSRAKDREKKLEHMNKINKPQGEKRGVKFAFSGDLVQGKDILAFKDCVMGYTNKRLVSPFSFILKSDDRLAIMGDNGVGKTTLLRSIMKEIDLIQGEINHLRPLNIGYLKQSDFSLNDIDESVLEYMSFAFPKMSESEIRTHLGKFEFHDDDVYKSVSVLSGGEKMRLLLAKIVLGNYDLLLLDEPTNHLDLLTKQALINAFSSYNASLIMVSHDRYFVDALANKILYIQDGVSYFHEGNYESFKAQQSNLFTQSDSNKIEPAKKEKVEKKNPSISVKSLEEKIQKIETRLKEIKEEENLEVNYMDTKKMTQLDEEYKSLLEKLKKLEEEYLKYI